MEQTSPILAPERPGPFKARKPRTTPIAEKGITNQLRIPSKGMKAIHMAMRAIIPQTALTIPIPLLLGRASIKRIKTKAYIPGVGFGKRRVLEQKREGLPPILRGSWAAVSDPPSIKRHPGQAHNHPAEVVQLHQDDSSFSQKTRKRS
jgi:hypothetical protein